MSKYVLDSWSWIEYFEGSRKGEKVRAIVTDSRNEVYTHSISIAEIVSKAERRGKDSDEVWLAINNSSKVIETNSEESKDAGKTHVDVKSKTRNFSLADAFVLSTARRLRAKVVTGDPDFKNIPDVLML
jgi:predicted nucleic acid-binding protein